MNCIMCGKRLPASNTTRIEYHGHVCGIGRDCARKAPKLLAVMQNMADDERRNGYEKSACRQPVSTRRDFFGPAAKSVQVAQEMHA